MIAMSWRSELTRVVALIGVLVVPRVAEAQADGGAEPRWHELAPTPTERVAVDLRSIELAGSIRRARLRWNLVSIRDVITTYTIEDTEVDCARQHGRIRSRRRVTHELPVRRTEVEDEVSASTKN